MEQNTDFIKPFSFLNNQKGKESYICLKDNKLIIGNILAFDLYLNLLIKQKDRTLFIKGDNILYISNDKDKD